MTLPYERTRSVIQTEEFLRELSNDHQLPAGIRNEATRLLRHYPTADLIKGLGRFEKFLTITSPDDEKLEVAIRLHHRLFSDSAESGAGD